MIDKSFSQNLSVSNLLIFQPKAFQQWMVMPKSNAIKKGEPVDLNMSNLFD